MADGPLGTRKNDSWFRRLGFDKRELTLERWQRDLSVLQQENKIEWEVAKMVQAILGARELTVRDIMVPRARMVTLAIDDPFAGILEKIVASGHSRFPVLARDHEEMSGVLLSKDLLKSFGEHTIDLASLLRPIDYVPEGKYVTALLNEFRERRSHLALVVDEYGAVSGLITIEDILEQIVGEIDDEHDHLDDKRQVKRLDEQRFLIDAMISVDEFNEVFHADLDDDEVETISGLLMTLSGSLPKEGEEIAIGRFVFKVLPYDGKFLSTLELVVVPEE